MAATRTPTRPSSARAESGKPRAKAAVKKPSPAAKTARSGGAGTASPAKSAAARKSPAKRAATAPRKAADPKRALASTRRLLEAKRARDRQPQPWQALDPQRSHAPQPGYQSESAAAAAQALHAGESRMAPIHGSISTRDRKAQGKRDHRESGE